jgi:hypothetical protein
MMKKVAILGFGPSALYAITACNELGIYPRVLADKPLLSPAGAFYLHSVPKQWEAWMTPYDIHFVYKGSEEIYIRKQWGSIAYPYDLKTSWGKYSEEIGYKPGDFYNAITQGATFDVQMGRNLILEDLPDLAKEYDKVFCTIPFHSKPFVRIPVITFPAKMHMNTIEYIGTLLPEFVRESSLFGTVYIEFPEKCKPYVSATEKLVHVNDISPLAIAGPFDRTEDGVVFIGRNARYDRNELAHHAYERVLNELRGSV